MLFIYSTGELSGGKIKAITGHPFV